MPLLRRFCWLLYLALFATVGYAQTQPRLANLSLLTNGGGTGTGPGALSLNFIIEGTAPKPLLIRVVGPTLAALGVSGALADPILTLYGGTGATVATNNDWGGTTALLNAFSQVGAFPFRPADSKDAALLVTLSPGTYTASVAGGGGFNGTVLLEIYEMDNTPRLVYLSTRGQIAAAVSSSFVIGGAGTTGSATLLIRALGPALGLSGVPGALANPTLSVLSGSTPIANNDNWGGVSALNDAAATAGLMPLPATSTDSALLVTVAGGAYNARLSGVGGATGIGMVEFAQIDANRAASFVPALLVPPYPVSISLGSSVTLPAVAVGKPAPTFQWRKNGAAVPGATSSAYAFSNFTAADVGNYSVVLSNSAGTTISADFVVSSNVPAAPAIATQPVTQAVAAGGTATFAVAATGTPAPAYQWRLNGVALAGATNSTLTIANAQAANAGTYTVSVTNSAGTVNSASAALRIVALPVISRQPTAQVIPAGNPATFSVVATSTTALLYQWRKDGINITGATRASYTIAAVQAADAGSYSCMVINLAGSVASNAVTLTVTRNYAGTYFGSFEGGRGSWALVIRSDHTGTYVALLNNPREGIVATVQVFTDGTFRTTSTLTQTFSAAEILAGRRVAAAGVPFTVSGSIGTTTVSGTVEGLNLTFTGALEAAGGDTTAVSGIYQATRAGSATTTYAVVGSSRQVLALTVGATSVDGGLGTVGSNGLFTVTTPTNTNITGAIVPASGAITATIASSTGPAESVTGTRTAGLGPPIVVTAPAAQTVTPGTSVTLAVTVGGKTPLTYQWRKDGVAIAGATGATHSIGSAEGADAGNYTCAIANSEGNVTSPAAALAVIVPPGRIVNLSVRTVLAASQTLSVGFYASAPKSMLIRAVGPTLGATPFNLAGTISDPKIDVFDSAGVRVDGNEDWSPALSSVFASVAAFSLVSGGKDAALQRAISGSTTMQITGTGPGLVLVESYDTSGGSDARLTNVSARNRVGVGDNILVAGFVVAGGSAKVLIRGVGPALGLPPFGLSDVLVDPKLEIYDVGKGAKIDENDNWESSLVPTFASVAAFALPTGSRDSALVITLPPGAYTAQLSGIGGTTGDAIIEVYELP